MIRAVLVDDEPPARVRMRQLLDVSRDIVAATAVQSHMWPGALPRIPGFDCAAASLAARGVGGDFYDLFPLNAPSQWALLLGDASGKGIAAGLVGSAVQARVRSIDTGERRPSRGVGHLTGQANADRHRPGSWTDRSRHLWLALGQTHAGHDLCCVH